MAEQHNQTINSLHRDTSDVKNAPLEHVDSPTTGKYDGEEVVQLYLQDKVASVVRPVKELKDFQKVMLKAGETKTISFTINKEKLAFFNQQLKWGTEPGDFKLMIGTASDQIKLEDTFILN